MKYTRLIKTEQRLKAWRAEREKARRAAAKARDAGDLEAATFFERAALKLDHLIKEHS